MVRFPAAFRSSPPLKLDNAYHEASDDDMRKKSLEHAPDSMPQYP